MADGFFSKLLKFFAPKEKKEERFKSYNKFKHFLDAIDEGDPSYAAVEQAAILSDEALFIAKQRIKIGGKLRDIYVRLEELECYNSLTEEDAKQLRSMLDYFLAISGERSMLLNQLSDFDKSLPGMFQLENDAIAAIPQIKEAETNQRILRQDLGYLHGEKESLLYDRESMENGLRFIQYFAVGMVVLFVAVTAVLTIMFIMDGREIFWPIATMIVLVLIIAGLLYAFKQRLRHEMRRNHQKQSRAVELLNKKNVVYAYYTNYLRYSYKKYKVRNSQMLASHLEDFSQYKYLLNRIDNIRLIMYETEGNIERFLREKKLEGVKGSIESFARTINLENKKRYYNDLAAQREKEERELASLEDRHEEIWETLSVLGELDSSPDLVIKKIMHAYMDEAARLFENAGKRKMEDENLEDVMQTEA